MKLKTAKLLVILCLLAIITSNSQTQDRTEPVKTEEISHSLELSPMSPFINIYAIQYGYSFDKSNDIILGLAYMAIPQEGIGRTHASSLIVGYRRNFGNGWHAEYSLYPTYDNYFETNEKKYYNSYDLWNEFRFGCQYDFQVSNLPVFIKAQVPFGFAIYASNKPQKFLDREKERDNRFFYKAVLVFIGIRF
jgi:hypothetical protein